MEQSPEAETEPKKQGELRSRWEGSHSPFGFIWQIADATGWSVDYILWGVNYQTLVMMMSDAPKYVDSETVRDKNEKCRENKAKNVVGFFQSKLKADGTNRD